MGHLSKGCRWTMGMELGSWNEEKHTDELLHYSAGRVYHNIHRDADSVILYA